MKTLLGLMPLCLLASTPTTACYLEADGIEIPPIPMSLGKSIFVADADTYPQGVTLVCQKSDSVIDTQSQTVSIAPGQCTIISRKGEWLHFQCTDSEVSQ